MRIFVIHSLSLTQKAIEYAKLLEANGHSTYVPGRDTDESDLRDGDYINSTHLAQLRIADRVDALWDHKSLGMMFDLGMAYALGKTICPVYVPRDWVTFFTSRLGKKIVAPK